MDFPHNLWDLSGTTLPQQITNLDESDFLSILSKQLNPTAAPSQQISAQALAQQINQQQGVSPPVSEESSPSPPTTTNRGLAKSSSDAAAAGADGHKRKKIQRDESEESDSDDEQPPSKSQKEQPKKATKRKSTGDENRANKRKEQNRAAQRAFRERKEKHVRDLEDQVTALEQKSTAQATENENLRELLGRLQNENLMLKQSAFTFNFNSAQTPRSTATPTITNSRTTPSAATSPIEKSPSAAPSAASKDSNSQQQQVGGSNANGTGYTPLLSFSSLGSTDNLISMGTPPSTNSNNTGNSPPLTFFSPPPTSDVPSPYTTLASNPMYTSYTDFSAWDQFFQNAAMDQSIAGIGSDPSLVGQANPPSGSSSRMEDLLTSTDNFSELIPFSSFSPGSGNNNNGAGMMTGLSPSGSSPIDHVATSAKAAINNNSGAFSLASREATNANRPSLPVRSSSPCGGADPDEAPLPGSTHHNPNMTSMNISRPNMAIPPEAEHDGTKCPKSKEDLAKMIEGQPLSTLGSVAGIPQTYSEQKTMKLKEVWDALKQHPRFEECDMDELCRELSSKVKCDGGMPGLDESDKPCEELSKLIDAVKAKKAEEAKAAQQVKQQQRVIQSISTGGLPESTMTRSPPTASTNSTASPNMMSNFNLFGNSPYNSYLPFAMPPQSASSTTSQFTMPQSATTTDFGFDSRRPSLGGVHNSSGSNDGASFMSSGSSNVATPQSNGANGSTPIMVDQSSVGLPQTTATDSWLAGAFEMPSPNSQFLSFLSGGGGAFSPNSYLNLPDKE